MDYHIPIGLPSHAFHALIEHSGEAFYSDKCADILSQLIFNWVAATPASPASWAAGATREDEDEDEYSAFTDADLYQPEPTPAAAPPAPSLPAAPAAASIGRADRGYQWKRLFLPNGTELRTIYCGHSLYATIENEQIISGGRATTPSRLANVQGCGTRNAWKTIWLRFPGAKRWELAARCRDDDR